MEMEDMMPNCKRNDQTEDGPGEVQGGFIVWQNILAWFSVAASIATFLLGIVIGRYIYAIKNKVCFCIATNVNNHEERAEEGSYEALPAEAGTEEALSYTKRLQRRVYLNKLNYMYVDTYRGKVG